LRPSRQPIGRHRLRYGGKYKQVTAFGHFLEISNRRISLGVHNDVLKVAVTRGNGRLFFVHDLKRQSVAVAALAPFDGGTDGVAIPQEGWGEPLKKSGQVYGSCLFANSAF